jgi:hypothetical protein
MTNLIILAAMLFCHIIDDYYLQGILASMKQKNWWVKNAPDDLYKKDYIMALFMHSFSWAFMIMLPILVHGLSSIVWNLYVPFLIVNCVIHMVVDNLKANMLKINLVQDQSIHMLQIFITWLIWVSM